MMSHPQDYIWGPGTLIKAINYTSHRKDFRQVVNETAAAEGAKTRTFWVSTNQNLEATAGD